MTTYEIIMIMLTCLTPIISLLTLVVRLLLIIIDKKTAEVKEIKTIAASDKDSIKKFREWIEKDGISFFEYSKTLKEIF